MICGGSAAAALLAWHQAENPDTVVQSHVSCRWTIPQCLFTEEK